MNQDMLKETVRALMAPGKGILAADESAATVEKRFAPIHLENTEDNRRAFRELFFTAPGVSEYISGVILFDETIRQNASSGKSFVSILQTEGIVPGIKVDKGTEPMPGSENEKRTKGLDDLAQRMEEYGHLGARFAKWRAVITIGEGLPTAKNILENTSTLAKYARICQEAGIVPIVEPEVLMDGNHTIEQCRQATIETHTALFVQLVEQGVILEGLILKSNMVVPGKDCPEQATAAEIAEATLGVFTQTVPSTIGGIVFLSGGQSEQQATENLNEMNKHKDLPWPLTFSYARALQDSATKAWAGKLENIIKAQETFVIRAKLNSLARRGEYTAEMEPVGIEGFQVAQANQD
jgi:fructose-bisphosphate aldolase class I